LRSGDAAAQLFVAAGVECGDLNLAAAKVNT